jgi:hypothetical protein
MQVPIALTALLGCIQTPLGPHNVRIRSSSTTL